MKTTSNNIMFVGNLQVFSSPYASLYLDRDDNKLCVFVRVSPAGDTQVIYAIKTVTKAQLGKYMHKRIGLRSLFVNGDYMLGQVGADNNLMIISVPDFDALSRFNKNDRFKPEYCEDEPVLRCFLNSYNNI